MDSDGMPGASFLSPTVLACFLTAFGAFGLVFTEIPMTQNVWLHAPLAFLCAVLIAVLVWWGMNKVFRNSQSSSEGKVGNLVGATAAIISPTRVRLISVERPVRKARACSTSARYSSCPIRSTQGAEQRLIWYCRQGRVRLAKMLSLHERSRKARCSAVIVRLTAPAEANGPK